MKSILLAVTIAVLCRTSIAKPKPTTYDLVLAYMNDGAFRLGQDKAKFLSWYETAGLTEQQVVDLGRNAADFFKKKFNVDFTNIEEKFYTSGAVTRHGGKVTFQSYLIETPDNDPLRVVSAVDHKNSALFTNAPIIDLGWIALFNEDFNSTGSSDLTIPARSFAVYGHYLVQVGMDKREQNDPFFPKQALDNGVLSIQYQSKDPFFPPESHPAGRVPLVIVNLDVYNKYYGEGRDMGFSEADMENGGFINVNGLMRFPREI